MAKSALDHRVVEQALGGSASRDVSVPDAVMPEQYFERMGSASRDTPERRLMFAVLLDAVAQLRRTNSVQAREAERWIRGVDGEDWPFSFANVCGALGIDPRFLAEGLLDPTRRMTRVIPARHLRILHHRVRPPRRRRRRRRASAGASAA